MREPGALKHFADGGLGRPRDRRIGRHKFHPQLARPPVPAMPRGDDVRAPSLGHPAGKTPRHPTAIGQPRDALAIVTRQPLVDRLASDAIDLSQRLNAFALVVLLNQSDTEVHRCVLLPRHRFPACRSRNPKSSTPIKCYPCPRIVLLPMSPVWTPYASVRILSFWSRDHRERLTHLRQGFAQHWVHAA